MRAGSRLEDTEYPLPAKPLNKYTRSSRQNQSKRQREWVYLSHYLMISSLNPLHIISGQDDGREPDFTLIFYQQRRLYYVGIELTTLPRLREQMGDTALIAKRWYWQGWRMLARQRRKQEKRKDQERDQENSQIKKQVNNQRLRLPVKMLNRLHYTLSKARRQSPYSRITQADVEAAMQKKAHKVSAYHERRPLDELWLLIHTDKYQCQYEKNWLLLAPNINIQLTHNSDFDRVHITRYPSHSLIEVKPRRPRAAP